MTTITTGVEVRTASLHDVVPIGRVLGRAFHDDPVFTWAIPDPDDRRAVLPGFFTVFTAAFQRHGHVHRTADGTAGALWAPPGVAAIGDDEADQFGAALEEVCGANAERLSAISALLDENHPHEPAWYLNFLGVEPAGQGQGVGSALLDHVLSRADRDGSAACLDATSPRNRQFYERHGFTVTTELVVPGGPPMWPMWRAPRGG
jgi:ribosomal protein S18 acetylase RimI-like enzyme